MGATKLPGTKGGHGPGRPFQKGVVSNPRGRPPLHGSYTQGLRDEIGVQELARLLAEECRKGNLQAIIYAYNRLEGAPAQVLQHEGGDADKPIHVHHSPRQGES